MQSKGGCAGASGVCNLTFLSSQWTGHMRKLAVDELLMSVLIFNHNWKKKKNLVECLKHVSHYWDHRAVFGVLLPTLSPFLAVLRGEILRQCARLWFLYVYFCYSRRCPSAAVISHMLHIGTFHRFKQFSAIDVFQARRTAFVPADLIHLFQLWGRSAGVYRKSYVTERLPLEMIVLSAQLHVSKHNFNSLCQGEFYYSF